MSALGLFGIVDGVLRLGGYHTRHRALIIAVNTSLRIFLERKR
jgi:hypothetical protein